MSLFEALTDDQVAIFGCVAALATAFGLMSLTWTIRQAAGGQPKTRSLPERPQSLPSRTVPAIRERKAA